MDEAARRRSRGAAARFQRVRVARRQRARDCRDVPRAARARSGTTSAAAPVGVGARTSATKSQIVKSVSWPTPDTIGSARLEDRARDDLLVERPQVLDRAAAAARRSARRLRRARSRCAIAAAISAAAPSPCTGAGIEDRRAAAGQRRRERRQHVAQRGGARRRHDADARAETAGSGRLRSAANQPAASSRAFSRANFS